MIVDKCGNYVRKLMWQLWGWGTVDICMTCAHTRAKPQAERPSDDVF
jgi:hypothetical protein